MRYVVAGGTSSTGNAVIKRLADKVGPENISCIVRAKSEKSFLKSLRLDLHPGDVSEPETFKSILSPSVIYLDMTHPKHYHKSLEAVVSSGVERAYFVTTTGIFSEYRQCADIYILNEERIRKSGIIYTILRPSMIYGSLKDKNMHKLILFLDRFPIFPVFGRGAHLMQPVHTEDLADVIVAAIDNQCTEGQEYNLAGPEAISYREIIDSITGKLGRNVLKINLNATLAYWLVRAFQWIPFFPINDEQVLRLKEDKVFDISSAVTDLSFSPRSFEEGIAQEIEEMYFAGLLSHKSHVKS